MTPDLYGSPLLATASGGEGGEGEGVNSGQHQKPEGYGLPLLATT